MLEERHLTDFADRLKKSGGANLVSVVLYGSAAAQEFHAEFSDVNMLCVLGELAPAHLAALAPAVLEWTRSGHPAPLIFPRHELERAADVFAIEMLDIKQHHRILFGADIFQDLPVPMDRHRIQLEHELRTKLLFLRQHYLLSSADNTRVLNLMLDSVSNFITLFRHTLITLGEIPLKTRREIVQQLAGKIGFDARSFLELLDVRERKLKADTLDAQAVFSGYLQAIENVIQMVDAL